MEKIHDNLPSIILPWLTIFDWIIITTIFLIILYLIINYFFFSKKKIEKPIIKVFIPKPFSLNKELKKLIKLKKQENWKSFALLSTKLLKKILEQKFKKSFIFATSKELQSLLKNKLNNKKMNSLQTFFLLLDPIKFAKANTKKEITDQILEILKYINK